MSGLSLGDTRTKRKAPSSARRQVQSVTVTRRPIKYAIGTSKLACGSSHLFLLSQEDYTFHFDATSND